MIQTDHNLCFAYKNSDMHGILNVSRARQRYRLVYIKPTLQKRPLDSKGFSKAFFSNHYLVAL
jgi:hypothetical protein